MPQGTSPRRAGHLRRSPKTSRRREADGPGSRSARASAPSAGPRTWRARPPVAAAAGCSTRSPGHAATRRTRQLNGAVMATVSGHLHGRRGDRVARGWSLQLTTRTVLRLEGERPVETLVLASSAGLAQVFGMAAGVRPGGAGRGLAVRGSLPAGGRARGRRGGLRFNSACGCSWLGPRAGACACDLWITGDGFVMRGPAPILLTQLLLVMLFTAMLFAFAGWIAREQLTGHETMRVLPHPVLAGADPAGPVPQVRRRARPRRGPVAVGDARAR